MTARLAEAGARVIKIERPEGDFARGYDSLVHGESVYFVWLNRGKDGKDVLFSIQNEREWQMFCRDVLECEAIATDERFINNTLRVKNRPALDRLVDGTFPDFGPVPSLGQHTAAVLSEFCSESGGRGL